MVARATATVLFYTYRGTYLTLRPLLEDPTIDAISTGTRLPPRDLLRNALQQGVVLPFILALLSTAVLRRREWALPTAIWSGNRVMAMFPRMERRCTRPRRPPRAPGEAAQAGQGCEFPPRQRAYR